MSLYYAMRPQDLVVLLKIIAKGTQEWLMKDLALELEISNSEVSESIKRSIFSGLLSSDKKTVMKLALLDFLKCGLKYVYPQKPGGPSRGIPTAHSAEPLASMIQSNEIYVWPHANGSVRGFSIEPLYTTVPDAVLKDPKLYELLALTDALRLGNAREQQLAIDELKDRFD